MTLGDVAEICPADQRSTGYTLCERGRKCFSSRKFSRSCIVSVLSAIKMVFKFLNCPWFLKKIYFSHFSLILLVAKSFNRKQNRIIINGCKIS